MNSAADRQAKKRWRSETDGQDSGPDDDYADEERQERRNDEVVDRKVEPRCEHAHEMHCPHGESERDGGAREQDASARAGRVRDTDRQPKANIGSLDGENDG